MPPKVNRTTLPPISQLELAAIAQLLRSDSRKQEGLDLLASKGGIPPIFSCHGLLALKGTQLAKSRENVLTVLATLPGGIHFRHPSMGTWIEQAILTGVVHIVERALDLGADPNSMAMDGNPVITNVLAAKELGNRDEDKMLTIFELLLNAGADPNTLYATNTTLVEQLALMPSSFRYKLLTILCSRQNLKISGEINGKPICCVYAAVQNNNIKALQLLLKHGADPTALGPGGHSPLMHAINFLHWDSTRELIMANVPVNETGLFDTHRTPLEAVLRVMIASPTNRQTQEAGRDIVKLLLMKGADPFKESASGTSGMSYAISHDRIDCLTLFANANCNFDRPVTNSTSPLLFALMEASMLSAKWLLQRGVDTKTANARKITPLHFATVRGDTDIFQRILQQSLDQVNLSDNDGRTPLLLAAESGNAYFVDRLLQAGANPRFSQNLRKCTALIAAASHNFLDCVKSLVRVSDVNAQMADGTTALFFAAQEGKLPLCKLLVEHGADRTIKRGDGASCLQIAVEENHMDVVQYLLQLERLDGDDSIVECDVVDRILLGNGMFLLVYSNDKRPKTDAENALELNLLRQKFPDISDKDAQTGLEFLRRRGLSVTEINALRQPAAATSADVATIPAPAPCYWFNTLSRDDARIRPIEGMFTSDNCYLVIDEAALTAQNCIAINTFIHAGKKFAARVGESGIVSLRGNQLTVAVTINGTTETKTLTDEIKVKKGPERILCFREMGSDGRSTLLVGCIAAPLGLHQPSHNSRIAQSVTLTLTQQESITPVMEV